LSEAVARIGHTWLDRMDPEGERGTLREDLEHYIVHAELGAVADTGSDWFLPPAHPYISWLAEALDSTPRQLFDATRERTGGVV